MTVPVDQNGTMTGVTTFVAPSGKTIYQIDSYGNLILSSEDISGGASLFVKGTGTTSSTTPFFVEDYNGNNVFTITGDGNIGVGITQPNDIMHLQKDDAAGSFVKLGNIIGSAFILLATSAEYDSYFQLNYLDGNWAVGQDGSDGNKFKIANAANFDSNVAFTIDTHRNVGVNTSDPSGASLFVKGTGTTSGTTPFAIVNSDGQTDWMVSGDGTESIRSGNTFFLDRTNSYGIWTGSDGKAYIKDVSGEREL